MKNFQAGPKSRTCGAGKNNKAESQSSHKDRGSRHKDSRHAHKARNDNLLHFYGSETQEGSATRHYLLLYTQIYRFLVDPKKTKTASHAPTNGQRRLLTDETSELQDYCTQGLDRHEGVAVGFEFDGLRDATQQVDGRPDAGTERQELESVARYADADVGIVVVEVDDNEQFLLALATEEGNVPVGVETASAVVVGIHQVVADAFAQRRGVVGQAQHAAVGVVERLLLGREVGQARRDFLQRLHAPLVEDGGETIFTAETFSIHASFAQLLSGIDHEGTLTQQGRHD